MYSVVVRHSSNVQPKEPTICVEFMIKCEVKEMRSYHPHEWPLMGMRIRDWVEEGRIGS